jgi:pilus assembly protein Flp/PilA
MPGSQAAIDHYIWPFGLLQSSFPVSERIHPSRRTADGGAATSERRTHMIDFLMRPDEDGQGLAEYALILALIAIIAIAALIFLGTQISTILSTIGDAI